MGSQKNLKIKNYLNNKQFKKLRENVLNHIKES